MSSRYSWIAVQEATTPDILLALGLEETSDRVEVLPGTREIQVSYRMFPNGWMIVFGEDFDWASEKRIVELSRLGTVVGCQFEDQVENAGVATGAEDGVVLWRVAHNNDPKKSYFDVRGNPPASLGPIRDRLFKEQEEFGDADYVADIPLELAKTLCGFKLGEGAIDETFIALKPIGAPDEQAEYGWRPGMRRRKPSASPSTPAPRRPKRVFVSRYSPMQAGLAAAYHSHTPDFIPGGNQGSWIAVKDASLDEILKMLRLRPHSVYKVGEPNDRIHFAYVTRPDGWIVIVSPFFKWAIRTRILQLSRLGLAVGLQFEDYFANESIATGAENGTVLWRVSHGDGLNKIVLNVEGAPPPAFPGIRDRLFLKQAESGGDQSDTDFIHEVPIRTAEAVCGYHRFETRVKFMALETPKQWFRIVLSWVGMDFLSTPTEGGMAPPKYPR